MLFEPKQRTSAEAARWVILHGLDNIELLEAAAGLGCASKLGQLTKDAALSARAKARLGHLN